MPDAITANLSLPLMAAAQAQKHVTHNEALVGLDTLVQLAVLDKDLTAPPANPAEGDRYLIAGAAPTGAWAGWAGRVVRYQDGAWRSFPPRPGWLAFVADEADLYTYTGMAWASFRSTLTVLQNLTRLGIGTTADAGNPFAAKLNKALWTALTTGEGGTGDLRYTLNKQAAGNVLSLLFQSGFSGRAELGLTGDDDLRVKVSGDGGTWREALRVDRNTGGLDFAAAEASAPIAGTVDLGGLGALRVVLTGSGTVTSFGTAPNRVRLLRFTDAATLTHNAASLALPGGANLVTAAGDTAVAVSDAAGTWRVVDYARASGKAVTGPAAADILDASGSGRSVLTGSPGQGATAIGVGLGNIPTFAGLNVVTGSFDGTVSFETQQAPANSYRRKTLFSSINVGGGNDLLIRSTRPSDGGFVDHVLSASAPGTILTTGSTAVSPTFAGMTVTNGGVFGDLRVNAGGNTFEAGGTIAFGISPFPGFAPMAAVQGRLGNATGSELQGDLVVMTRPVGASGAALLERMRVTSRGLVGIGTANPQVALDVSGGAGARLGGVTAAAAYFGIGNNAAWGGIVLGSGANGNTPFLAASRDGNGNPLALSLQAGSVTAACLLPNGNVGIGTTNPGALLDVAGSAAIGGTLKLGTYIVSTLPAGVFGSVVHVSNGRKVGEGSGSGTGVVAYYSNGNWRRLSDDSPVAA